MLIQLQELARSMHLNGMLTILPTLLSEGQQGAAIQDIIQQLLEKEYQYRQTRGLENRLKNAKIPMPWTLDTFPFKQQPAVNKMQMMTLSKLDFIRQYENLIFIGKPGVGKSGLAMSLLRQAITDGYRGRFYNAQDLLNELYTSLADKTTSKLLNKLLYYDVLVIDELGYLTLTSEQINMFFKLIDMRYHKKSTIITTNLDYPQWYDVFNHKDLVDAMLDRFKHYCVTIRIDGLSLRGTSEA